MYEVQKFALENIYCAPSQDRQFSFHLKKVTKSNFPVKRMVNVYSVNKHLPNASSFFHVFVIGNLNPSIINLLRQKKEWYRDKWINVQEDINNRNILIQMYNELGVMFPRQYIYYSFIDESSIIIAIELNESIRRTFDVESFKYFRVYSNSYFNTQAYNSLPIKHGIKCELNLVETNTYKVQLQNKINTYKQVGGDVILYVNGYYTDNLNLNIPNNSYIELVYDQSILSKEKYTISSLRTFMSDKDNTIKYLLFREKHVDFIQYEDDNEIYISTDNELVTKGLYFYEHQANAVRNVTDKDYSLNTAYVNNQASTLSQITTGSLQDKIIILYTRRSGINKSLVYSSLKLHELYKLPQDVELDVLSNMNYTINELRAETLENSDYFKVASASSLKDITADISTSAVGYNGLKYYYANSPKKVNEDLNIPVPLLFHKSSYAYEYNAEGRLININVTNGPLYTCSSNLVEHVEFIKGQTPNYFDPLYNNTDTITLKEGEYKLISAYFNDTNRISNWEDITNSTSKLTILNDTVILNEDTGKKVKIVYMNEPVTYDLEIPLVDGVLYFPLTVEEDRGTGIQNFIIDIPYRNVEVFLNGYRLHYNIDYFVQYPYISICSKMYFDHSKENQSVHIRLHGYTLNKEDINQDEITGFINNGVLTRNNYYDIRDDRVFSVYIKGKLYERSLVSYAEEDNTVRLTHSNNGLPYTVSEHMVSVKEICGQDTLSLYTKNKEVNKKISDLYNLIFKEPDIDTFNTIPDHYYLFSPLVSKMLHDALEGDLIPPSLYMNPYNDTTILTLIEEKYKTLYTLDPIRQNLPMSIIEIHPLPTNEVIDVPLHLYRFITNVIRIITNNQPNRINISGYLSVTTTNVEAITTTTPNTGGVVVL